MAVVALVFGAIDLLCLRVRARVSHQLSAAILVQLHVVGVEVSDGHHACGVLCRHACELVGAPLLLSEVLTVGIGRPYVLQVASLRVCSTFGFAWGATAPRDDTLLHHRVDNCLVAANVLEHDLLLALGQGREQGRPLITLGHVVRIGLPHDVTEHFRMISLEVRVTEFYLVDGSFVLFKVVHVQLPNERVHVLVFEIAWQDFFDEALSIVHLETFATIIPGDNSSEGLLVEHIV